MFWATDWSTIADPVDRNASSTRTLELVCCTGHICAEFRSFIWSHSICWLIFFNGKARFTWAIWTVVVWIAFPWLRNAAMIGALELLRRALRLLTGLAVFWIFIFVLTTVIVTYNTAYIWHLEYSWNTVASISWRNASLRARAPDSVLWTGLLVVASFTLLVQFIRVIQTVVFT